MTKQEFEALVARGPVLLDGAMGSNLLERGMPKGALSELWADRHPETVLELQTAYAAAGSRILYAPTFQAQPEALAQAGWTGDVGALNARLVALTRRAAGADTLVAGDLATMAGCLESWNPENFHRMTDRYRRQIGGLLEGGADLLVAETLLYPQEAEAVLLAAELEGGDLPVLYSFTMQPDGALFSGQEAGPVLRELIPPEALADEQFAAMIAEAEKYLGFPYVWGGSNPTTSFDCSGFVSWVINHSGWNVGRLTANGLLNISTPVSSANAKPGDLIFFQGTYNTSGASHVGIYVGGGMMIHCGDPISYASINTSYWQSHFYTFARLP